MTASIVEHDAVHMPGAADAPAMTAEQRRLFDEQGFLVVPQVLEPAELARFTAAVERVYEANRDLGQLAPDGSLHRTSAVAASPELAELMVHPKAFNLVWSVLGWNIHVYHSHLDVHPTARQERPFRFEWHQDGGRQNRELETDPRPRISVKLAFWLSDVSTPGRGNFKVVPGSHTTNWIDGPPRRDMEWPDPPGAIEVCANPGDVVLFDRRLWHARSLNRSAITRKAVFFGYTYRWVAMRDAPPGGLRGLTPVQRQLLGLPTGRAVDPAEAGDHAWGHYPEDVPLYRWLRDHGHLDPSFPPLRP
jgi:ectoine hydroxylase-related dioxygenase (phytanoyl-CoA dioxygenase family)